MNKITLTFEVASGDLSSKRRVEIPWDSKDEFLSLVAGWVIGEVEHPKLTAALDSKGLAMETIEEKKDGIAQG